jgi:hypothetical protein
MGDYRESYIAIVLLITIGTGMFVNPGKGRLQKWIYWCITPLLVVALLSWAYKSILGGLGMGSMAIIFLALGYLRFKLQLT